MANQKLHPLTRRWAQGDRNVTAAMVIATSSAGEAILSEVPPGLPVADRQAVTAFHVFLTQAGRPSDSPESTTKVE
jgi:hypothetical protein